LRVCAIPTYRVYRLHDKFLTAVTSVTLELLHDLIFYPYMVKTLALTICSLVTG